MPENTVPIISSNISSMKVCTPYHPEVGRDTDKWNDIKLMNAKNKSDSTEYSSPGLVIPKTSVFMDICEDIPVRSSILGADDITNPIVYPLGGHLNSYYFKDFTDNKKRKIYKEPFENFAITEADGLIQYSNNDYKLSVFSNWEGSFSWGKDNPNLIDTITRNDFQLYSESLSSWVSSAENYITFNNSSVFDSYDRIHIKGIFINSENKSVTVRKVKFEKEFTSLESGNYCFSFYIKGADDNLGISFTSGDEVICSEDVSSISSFYKRFSIRKASSNGKVKISFIMDNSGKDIDICGVCLSKGNSPIEVTYKTDGKFHPLALSAATLSDPVTNHTWTVKYKRYVFSYGNNIGAVGRDFIGGCILYTPEFPNEVESVTIRCNAGECDYSIVTNKGNRKKDRLTRIASHTLTIGGKDKSILLGGNMGANGLIPYPGIYRDVMIFPETYLSDDISDEIDNTLMSASLYSDNYSVASKGEFYLRSSLMREI